MQAAWPVLTFYLSILVAVGVGALALTTGNSPVLAALKAGTALLIFSALGWVLNVILFTAGTLPAARPSARPEASSRGSAPGPGQAQGAEPLGRDRPGDSPKSGDSQGSHDDSFTIDQASE